MIITTKRKKQQVTAESLKNSEQKQSLLLKRLTIVILIICAIMLIGAIVIFSKNLLGTVILIALFVLCGLIWLWIKKMWKKSESSISDNHIQAEDFVQQFNQVQNINNDDQQVSTKEKQVEVPKNSPSTHTNYFDS